MDSQSSSINDFVCGNEEEMSLHQYLKRMKPSAELNEEVSSFLWASKRILCLKNYFFLAEEDN